MMNILIGQSDFKCLRESNSYYVDKSIFVEEILKCPYQVILLPRPRRFGKTINISLLHHFFEKTDMDKSFLFDGLAIKQSDIFHNHFSKYPVIFMTFKDVKNDSFEASLTKIARLIEKVIYQNSYLMRWENLSPVSLNLFEKIMNHKATISDYEDSLQVLSEELQKYHNKQVIILIDEYDTPIHSGYTHNFYNKIVGFMRNLLSGGFKDNSNLFKGVITGTLRVSKESIFTGLNNLGVFTLLNQRFSTCFGFDETEVKKILADKGLADDFSTVVKWYDGYNFGGKKIFNPWSLVNYISDPDNRPEAYWLNTSSMEMIEDVILGKSEEQKQVLRNELTDLIQDCYIEKNIDENIIMHDLHNKNKDVIWSFLLYSGYLKSIGRIDNEFENIHKLSIPNMEVKIAYRKLVQKWFADTVNTEDLTLMLQALTHGDIALFEKQLKTICMEIMSYHDFAGSPEKVYHALVLGMLVWLANEYVIRSNRESGYGRYDIILMPKDKSRQGIIIEFKRIEKDDGVEDVLNEALKQIHDKKYDVELKSAGVKNILKIAVGFTHKDVYLKQGN
ncbi:9-O-acetyl-N-acetylneuraminate esterase [Candidatus Magnetomorum sp. HK-1]|nr:9-O-acetyl-N-acetylneuraminate esterase [Candidatus Magnetomorum sp. HK-1]